MPFSAAAPLGHEAASAGRVTGYRQQPGETEELASRGVAGLLERTLRGPALLPDFS